MWTRPEGRRHPLAVVLLAALAFVLAVSASPATAAPGDTDAEGGTPSLRAQLEAANRGFVEAQTALDASKKRQAELTQQLVDTESRLTALSAETTTIALAAYRIGGLRTASALLDSPSPDAFVDRATTINVIATRNDRQLRELARLRKDQADKKAALDAEVVNQQRQVDQMAAKKKDAEKALASVGGGAVATGPVTRNAATAQPAQRRADGSWPSESCSVKEPQTGGCVTPRTAHAKQQAQAAGFTRFVSCYRSAEDGGEHPRGRACDFAADEGGFGGVATGGDRTYGENLAAYYVKNANALAVLYVIWFKQIWQPSTGWRAYRSGNGDPSSDHTNHLHLSVI